MHTRATEREKKRIRSRLKSWRLLRPVFNRFLFGKPVSLFSAVEKRNVNTNSFSILPLMTNT
jgi:hypothetical protein